MSDDARALIDHNKRKNKTMPRSREENPQSPSNAPLDRSVQPAPYAPPEDTREHFLWQAAYHGGCARVMMRIVEQTPVPCAAYINLANLGNDVKRFARSAARWASAYIESVESAKALQTDRSEGLSE